MCLLSKRNCHPTKFPCYLIMLFTHLITKLETKKKARIIERDSFSTLEDAKANLRRFDRTPVKERECTL